MNKFKLRLLLKDCPIVFNPVLGPGVLAEVSVFIPSEADDEQRKSLVDGVKMHLLNKYVGIEFDIVGDDARDNFDLYGQNN